LTCSWADKSLSYTLSEADFKNYLNFFKDLVEISDKISMDFFYKQNDIPSTIKDDGSFVTEADKEIEKSLRQLISERFPDHSILGEEEGETSSQDKEFRWIIDPIDGTHGFMRGLPIWATLIALEHDGTIIASIVSAPALGSRWWAGIGHGAYKAFNGNEFKIKSSTVNSISDAQMLYTGIKESTEKWTGFTKLLNSVWRERGLGDFWGHCLVAEGGSEIMIDPIVNIWDVAALYLIVNESGGIMTDESGDLGYTSGHAITSNNQMHKELIKLINS